MAARRLGRAQRATALVPLALLSAAWTASLAGAGAGSATAGETTQPAELPPASLPDGTSVPTQAIEAPASVSSPEGGIAPGIGSGGAARAVSTASTSGIPSAALAAYQRAETVINAADKTCNISWQLVAAIGRVESDHGRYGGNSLDDQGVAQPGIYGIALDGSRGTQAIADTDAGQFDNDTQWDRAVGPMQFIPSTWSVVGVDADGDGQRNPQDIDDAALASAVYLCSGEDDLSSAAGQRAAVYRYNHSDSYVDLVLSIMAAYLDGEYTSVPNGTTAAGYIAPDPAYTPPPATETKGPATVEETDSVPTTDPTSPPTTDPSDPPTTDNPSNGGGGGDKPTKAPTALPPVTLPTLPTTGVTPVDETLTYAQAVVQCAVDYGVNVNLGGAVSVIISVLNTVLGSDKVDACIAKYTT